MKIDLHIHTSERSVCSVATAEEQIESCISRGLDAVVITDHDVLVNYKELVRLNEKYKPFKVFGGIEIRVAKLGRFEDILVIGVNSAELIARSWTYPELHSFVNSKGGFIALAHPYRFQDTIIIDVKNYPPHAVELYSSNIGKENEDRRLALAKELNCHLLTNSDGHSIEKAGIYYNTLHKTPVDEKELVEILKNGEFDICELKR